MRRDTENLILSTIAVLFITLSITMVVLGIFGFDEFHDYVIESFYDFPGF